MRQTLILPILLLAACNQPSPGLRGAVAIPAQAGAYELTIWRAGDKVEVIRHGYAPRADQPALRPAMAAAIVTTTGCALRPGTLEGDTGVLRATLDCP